MKILVIGGGAAGFFAALTAKETHPEAQVILLEKSGKLLSKVRISGGGRCNVTHHCFDPKALIENYPRGSKELLGPFHHFQPRDTIAWFESRGVPLKVEEDGRIFPVSDSSESIITCLQMEADRLGVEVRIQERIETITKEGDRFLVGERECDRLILATGSSKEGYLFAQAFGHTIIPPVPSLFTFNIPNFALSSISGVSMAQVALSIKEASCTQKGALLITHWGFSGPAALKNSAFAARYLAEQNYKANLSIDWLPTFSHKELSSAITDLFSTQKQIGNLPFLGIPKSLWRLLLERGGLSVEKIGRTLSKKEKEQLVQLLKEDRYLMEGKTTHKEEFVTCGGIHLAEVNFRTMESRLCKNLFFCGEILDIDGVTGGFNFQNAWTTGWVAGSNQTMR